MNKKQFLWFLLAVVIFVGAGWFGVRSAVSAREQMAAHSQQAADTIAAAFTGIEPESGFSFPSKPYVARLDVEGTIMSESAGMSLAGGGGYDHECQYQQVGKGCYGAQLLHCLNLSIS